MLKLVLKWPVSIPFDTLSVLSGLTFPSAVKRPSKKVKKNYRQPSKLQINIYQRNQILLFMLILLASEKGAGGTT